MKAIAKTKRNATATTSATRLSARNGVPASRPASTFPGCLGSVIDERVPAREESKLRADRHPGAVPLAVPDGRQTAKMEQ